MKKAFLLFLFSISWIIGFGQQQGGIEFRVIEWKEAVKEAKTQNKLIFFDAYTTWCGPCHKIQNNVFPDSDLGDFYNEHFINVKYDMERGEGVKLSRKYGIQVYPTLLFINPVNEKVVSHAIGYKTVEQLIKLAEQSILKANL